MSDDPKRSDDDPTVVDLGDLGAKRRAPRLRPGVITEAREAARKEKIDEEFAASKIKRLLDQYNAPLKCHVKEMVTVGTRTEPQHVGALDVTEDLLENFDETFAQEFGHGRYRLVFKFRSEYVGDHYLTVAKRYPKPGEREAAEEEKRKRDLNSPEAIREMMRQFAAELRPAQPAVDYNALNANQLMMIKAMAEALRPASAPASPLGFADMFKLFELFKGAPGGAAAASNDSFTQFERFLDLANKMGVVGGGGGDPQDLSLGREFLNKVVSPAVTAFSTEAGKGLAPKLAQMVTGSPPQPQLPAPSQPVPTTPPPITTAKPPPGSVEMGREELRAALKQGAQFRPVAPAASDVPSGEKKRVACSA